MAMARQQELMSDESPKEAHNGEEHPPRTESKRKKFRPFRAVRNMFRKRMRRQGSENLQDYKKSRSTTELQNEDGGRRFSSPNSPYSVGLSVSHDSIFSPDHATASLDPQDLRSIHGFLSVQHVEMKDLKNELFARVRARRDSDDEDAGLPHSPCTSPTTADILSQNLKSKSGISRTTCSEGSLISMGSSENDEDLMGMVLSSHSSRMSLLDKRFQDSDETDVSQPVPLSHKAAHHKIAVRPKRTHGLPRHRKQQLAASRLGSLPSTPEISEDSGRPSSGSLQSSEIYLSEIENPGVDSHSLVTSLDVSKKISPGETVITGDSMNNLSPLSPNEQLANVIQLKGPKCSISPLSDTSKWYINESLENICNNVNGKIISSDGENMSPETPNDEEKVINKDENKTNDSSNSHQGRCEKETKGVFSAWGAKIRKSDMDRSEKINKNDQDDESSEPFLSRWFGSRRSNRANKRNSDECSTPSPKEEIKQEKQKTSETDTKCSMECNGKNENEITTGNILEKRNLFLNLDVDDMHNETGLRNFTQSYSNREIKSQNLIGQYQLEKEFNQFSSKQVIKSSSDDCVHYSLNAGSSMDSKLQDDNSNFHGHKSKIIQKFQERDLESKAVTSTLTTWADLKKQNLKQEVILNSHKKENSDNNCKEMQRIKLFNGQTVDKVSQCERPCSLDIMKQTFNHETSMESNNSYSHWKHNLKNLSSNFKQEAINGMCEKDTFKTSSSQEKINNDSPISNKLKSEMKEIVDKNKDTDKTDKKCNDNENKDAKLSTVLSSDNKTEKVAIFQDFHLSDNSIDRSIDNMKEQSLLHNVTVLSSQSSATSSSSNGPLRLVYRRSNSISKADVKAQSTNNGNTYMVHKSPENSGNSSPDLKSCDKKESDFEVESCLTEQNKNVGKTRHSEEAHSKDGTVKQNFQSDNSLPPNSELFRVFARRSIKQKNNDKEKTNKQLDATTSKCINGQENVSAENNKCAHKSSLKDKIIDKDSLGTIVQNEKVQEIFIPRPRIVPVATQSKESNVEKRTQRNSASEIAQEIHAPRPRSHTTSEPSQFNDSVPEMRTRKSSVPESSKKVLINNKEELCEEVKSGRTVNDRDKSKSFKLNSTRNSPPDIRSADDNLQPSWLRLAQQRREQREQKEKQLLGSSPPTATETIAKPARSTKVLDMVSNFQKLQMT